MPAPLDSRRVERIHTRMLARYGTRWTGLWNGIDPDLIRADWASELAGISDAALTYALEHLPADKPPTSTQFRHLCLSYRAEVVALPAPEVDPQVARAVLQAFQRPKGHGPKAWAWDLKASEEAGRKLGAVQRRFWREALQHELGGTQ